MRFLLCILVIFGFMMTGSCYCLNVLTSKEPLIDIKPFIADTFKSQNIGAEKPAKEESNFQFNAVSMPVHSKARPGLLERVKKESKLAINVFVIGDDALSRKWLSLNKEKLQKMHVLGLVAEISSVERLQLLEEMAGMPLIATNVDALTKLLEISHYPFVFDEGVLWQ